jgi:hypothetical protein
VEKSNQFYQSLSTIKLNVELKRAVLWVDSILQISASLLSHTFLFEKSFDSKIVLNIGASPF